MEPIKSLDEKIFELSMQCKTAVYSNVDHKEFVRQLADKLEKLAIAAHREHCLGMLESSYAI
jgi:predicted mannosyl-3-phosphoglycerate phosphatase (HAD superfamily)